MFDLGLFETLVIGIILLLIFGNRLPSMMRSLGRGLSEFRQGLSGISHEIEDSGKPNLRGPDA